MRILLVLVLATLSCKVPTDPTKGDCGAGTVLARGTVVRITSQEREFLRSYDGPVEFGAGSEAAISVTWAYGPDGPWETVATQTIAPVPELPFEFCVTGKLPELADGEFSIHAELLQVPGRWSLHDLINEYAIPVILPAKNVVIGVSGLESCDEPNARGFCVR